LKDIQQNLRKEMGILYPPTGYFLEVDLWVPDLKLAFEFQVRKIKRKKEKENEMEKENENENAKEKEKERR
jgi:hypothetical protein